MVLAWQWLASPSNRVNIHSDQNTNRVFIHSDQNTNRVNTHSDQNSNRVIIHSDPNTNRVNIHSDQNTNRVNINSDQNSNQRCCFRTRATPLVSRTTSAQDSHARCLFLSFMRFMRHRDEVANTHLTRRYTESLRC